MKLLNILYHKIQSPVFSLQFLQLLRFSTLFLISIAFAKSNYSIQEIGTYEKFIYFAGALSFFWTNGIIQGFLALFSKYNSNSEQNRLILNSVLISFVFSLFVAILVFILEKQLSLFFINSEKIPFRNLFIAYLIFSPVTYFVEYIYIVRKSYKNIYLYGIVSNLLLLILLVIPAFIFECFEYSIYGLIIATFFRFIWLLFVLFKINVKSYYISIAYQLEIVKNSLPLILSAFIAGSIPYIDGLLVAYNYDESIFAIFRYGSRELPISVLLANAFSNAMIPILGNSKTLSISVNEIKSKSLKLIHVLFPISMVLLTISHFLFYHLFNPLFVDGASVFNVMILLVIPRMLFPQTILISQRKNKYTLIASVIELIAKIIFSLWLMTIWGIVGIALATFLAFLIEKIILVYFVYKNFSLKPKTFIPLNWLTFYSIILISLFLIVEYSKLF